MPVHVSSTCAHHQEVKIVLYSIRYQYTYRCDDTRGYVMHFWLPDDEHMCSKHVQAWNKLIVKQKFCAWSWLITDINILRCMARGGKREREREREREEEEEEEEEVKKKYASCVDRILFLVL